MRYIPTQGVHVQPERIETLGGGGFYWLNPILGDIKPTEITQHKFEQVMMTRHGHQIMYEGYPGAEHRIDVFGVVIRAGRGGDGNGGFTSKYSKDDVFAQYDAWANNTPYTAPVDVFGVLYQDKPKDRKAKVAARLRDLPIMPDDPVTAKDVSVNWRAGDMRAIMYKFQVGKVRYSVYAAYCKPEAVDAVLAWFVPMINQEIENRKNKEEV